MILLHAHVQKPVPGERDDFEGHSVHIIAAHRTSDEVRELLRRFTDSATEKEE
jgi:hypothetical protein